MHLRAFELLLAVICWAAVAIVGVLAVCVVIAIIRTACEEWKKKRR